MSGDRPVPGPDHSGATPSPESEADDTPQTPEEIAADVARQREQLAETVEELQARLDVRSRVRESMTTADGSLRPEVIAALAVGVAAVAGLLVLRWRRSR